MKQGILSLVSAVLILLPAATSAYPLRIWVMHNEIGARTGPVTKEQIREFTERLAAEDNIIIENDAQNLLMDDALDEAHPLANYILGKNEFLNELIRYRNAHEPGETIAVEFLRWNDAFSKLSAIARQGDVSASPDVVQIGSTWVATFADEGTIVDVSDHFDTAVFFPPSVESAHVFGRNGLFAVPWFVDTRVLFYWKKDIPSPERLADWNGFLDACTEVSHRQQKKFIGFPNTISWDLLHYLAPWLWAAGGDVLEPNLWGPIHGHHVVFDSPPSRDGMAYLKKLGEAGCAAFPSIGHAVLEERFLAGDYTTIIVGPWFVRRMIDTGPGENWPEHIGVTLPPAGPNGTHPFVGGSHLAVTAASIERGNVTRAIELIRHFTQPAAQMSYAKATGMLPAHREALHEYTERAETDVFRQALELGYSYPSIPEWGSVVENDIIRNHIWHIWHDIAHNASSTAFDNTIHEVASALRHKLMLALTDRYAPQAGLILMLLSIGGGSSVWWWRRRYIRALSTVEQKRAELNTLSAERAVLEGRMLMLHRYGDEQAGKLAGLDAELTALKQKTSRLQTELAEAKARHREMDRKRIGPFAISSDGSLVIDGEPVHFENNRQARRLIEHMTRMACRGMRTVHCLWGYVLFGWDPTTLQSSPQRLFETMVSKINGKLKHMGRPPLLGRVAKKVHAWKFAWEIGSICTSSSIHTAIRDMKVASDMLMRGDSCGAREAALAVNRLDPKNVDALATLRSVESDRNAPFSIGKKLIGDDLEMLRKGIAIIEDMLKAENLPRGIGHDQAQSELRLMRCEEEYLAMHMEEIFGTEREEVRPSVASTIASRMMAVRSEIAALQNDGVSGHHLWASVVESENFMRLISAPQMRTLVNNFYNHETESRENPHLTQLALVLMLSKPESLRTIGDTRSEESLIQNIHRGLMAEFKELEHHLLSFPTM